MVARWWPVGLSRDLGPGQVMAAMVPVADLAVWRAMSGRVAAWTDRPLPAPRYAPVARLCAGRGFGLPVSRLVL